MLYCCCCCCHGLLQSNDYGEASYWDKRYTDEVGLHKYEWYQSFDTLQPILAQHLGTGGRVLQVWKMFVKLVITLYLSTLAVALL